MLALRHHLLEATRLGQLEWRRQMEARRRGADQTGGGTRIIQQHNPARREIQQVGKLVQAQHEQFIERGGSLDGGSNPQQSGGTQIARVWFHVPPSGHRMDCL